MTSQRSSRSSRKGSTLSRKSKQKFSPIDAYFKTNPEPDLITCDSPYRNMLSDITKRNECDDSHFQTPKPAQPKKNVKWEISKTKNYSHKRSKKGKCIANSTIKIIEDNLQNSDVNPEHLQMGIMLSKSSYEAETSSGSSSTDNMPDLGVLANTILEKFGFKSNKSVETRKTEVPIRQRKRFKYITPTLLSRTEEDRDSMISSKISLILQSSSQPPNVEKTSSGSTLYSKMLSDIQCKSKSVFNIDNIYESARFKVNGLNLPSDSETCGCLLKDWESIPGRDRSPTGKSWPSQITQTAAEELHLPAIPRLNRSISPDLFESEDELVLNSKGICSPVLNKTAQCILNSQDAFDGLFDKSVKEGNTLTDTDIDEICSNVDFDYLSTSRKDRSSESDNSVHIETKSSELKNSDNLLLDTPSKHLSTINEPNEYFQEKSFEHVNDFEVFDMDRLKNDSCIGSTLCDTPKRLVTIESDSISPQKKTEPSDFIYISSESSNDCLPDGFEKAEDKNRTSLDQTFRKSLNITNYITEMLNSQECTFENPSTSNEEHLENKESECAINLSQESDTSAICDEELNYSALYSAPCFTDYQFNELVEIESNKTQESNFDYDYPETAINNPQTQIVSPSTECIEPIDANIQSATGNSFQTPNKSMTHSQNVVIKTNNVTPMQDYESMNTPTITKELERFGVKPLKRKRGAMLLKYIYETTHPVVQKSGNSESDEDDIKLKKCKNDQSMTLIEIVGDKILKNENLDELIFERRQSGKIPSCRVPLQIVWHNLVSSNPDIKENILLYEPLQLESLYMMLKELGFKFHIQDLLTFLDRKCITVRIKQNQAKKSKRF